MDENNGCASLRPFYGRKQFRGHCGSQIRRSPRIDPKASARDVFTVTKPTKKIFQFEINHVQSECIKSNAGTWSD